MIRLICGGILILIGLFMLFDMFITHIEGTSEIALATDLAFGVVPIGFGVLLIRGHFKKKHIRKALQEAQEKLRVEGDEIIDGYLLIGKIKGKTMTVRGTSYKLYRESLWRDWTLVLEESGHVLARANGFSIEYKGNQYVLEKEPIPWWKFVMRSPFVLLHGNNQIGSVRALSSSKAIVDLPESMPISVRVFIYCVVSRIWDL